MKLSKRTLIHGTALLTVLAVGCGKKEEDKDDEDSSTGSVSSGGGGSNSASSAKSVSDLKLSSAFNLDLPDALEESAGSGLNLLAGKRSQEACQMGQTVREVTRSLSEVGGFFCHLEVEKDKMAFGKKYRIVSGGQEFAKIWVDNSNPDQLKIGMCSKHGEDEQNSQLITISGLTSAGPKGSIVSSGSGNWEGVAQTYKSATTFDMSEAGLITLLAEQLHEQSGNQFNRKVELALKDAGISTAKVAAKGIWQGNEHQERGAAAFDGTYGSSIFQWLGTHEGQQHSFARRAYFNQSGQVVTAAEVPDATKPALTDVPQFLADGFTPASADGWVGEGCPDYDEDIELNPDSEAHQACDGNRDDSHGDCWSQDSFEGGSEQVTLD